jgi:hypothetical protein
MIKQPALKRAGAIIVHDDPIVAALSEWLVDYALDRAAAETEAEIEERKNLDAATQAPEAGQVDHPQPRRKRPLKTAKANRIAFVSGRVPCKSDS